MAEKLICDRLIEIIDPKSCKSGALEYGATESSVHDNHLYTYEKNNWRVLCLQPKEEKFNGLRRNRRLCKLIDCERDPSNSIDAFLETTNVPEIKILLIKESDLPSKVLAGFSSERWGTELICVEYPSIFERQESEKIILGKMGFKHYESISISEVYIKESTIKPKGGKNRQVRNIFEV